MSSRKTYSNTGIAASFLLVTALALAPFVTIFEKEFTNWDDPRHVTANSAIQHLTLENISFLFVRVEGANYAPLSLWSHGLDWALYGKDGWAHGVTNALLHALCSVLVIRCCRQAGLDATTSFGAGALFAVHPIHAESVAWISGRKDVLCSVFLLSCHLLFFSWRRSGKKSSYFTSVFCLALACLSKPLAISAFPVLWLYDVLILKTSIRPSLRSLSPHLAICFSAACVAVWSQNAGNAFPEGSDVRWGAVDLASTTMLMQMVRCFAPYPFSPFYPGSFLGGVSPFLLWSATVCLIGMSGYLLVQIRASRWRLLAFAWFAQLGFLAPVSGIIPLGFTSVADRYCYLPSIAACVIVAWLLSRLYERRHSVGAGVIVLSVLAAACSLETHRRARAWASSKTLWTTTLASYPDCAQAWHNLTAVEFDAGDMNGAYETAMQGLRKSNGDTLSLSNAVSMQIQTGRYSEAGTTLAEAIRRSPLDPQVKLLQVQLQIRLRQYDQALATIEQLKQLKPEWDESQFLESYVLEKTGDSDAALDVVQNGMSKNPKSRDLRRREAELLLKDGRIDEALASLEATTQAMPHERNAWDARYDLLLQMGRTSAAATVKLEQSRFLSPVR